MHKARLRRPAGRKPAARRPEEGEPSGLRLSLRAQPSWSTVGGFGGGWVPGNGAKRSSAKLGAQPNAGPVLNGGGPGYMGQNGGSEAGEGGQDGFSAEPSGGTLETSGGPPSTSWRVAANQELLLGTGRSADAGAQAPRSRACARTATHMHSPGVALQSVTVGVLMLIRSVFINFQEDDLVRRHSLPPACIETSAHEKSREPCRKHQRARRSGGKRRQRAGCCRRCRGAGVPRRARRRHRGCEGASAHYLAHHCGDEVLVPGGIMWGTPESRQEM